MNWIVRLLPIDIALSACIVSVAVGLCAAQAPLVVGKARLVEPLFNLGTLRVVDVERFALDGALAAPSGQPVPVADSGSTFGFAYQRDGSSLLASGGIGPQRAPFRLGLRPAVDDAGAGWSLLWLCGRREPPAGWTAVSPPLVEGLSPEQLPSICSNRQFR